MGSFRIRSSVRLLFRKVSQGWFKIRLQRTFSVFFVWGNVTIFHVWVPPKQKRGLKMNKIFLKKRLLGLIALVWNFGTVLLHIMNWEMHRKAPTNQISPNSFEVSVLQFSKTTSFFSCFFRATFLSFAQKSPSPRCWKKGHAKKSHHGFPLPLRPCFFFLRRTSKTRFLWSFASWLCGRFVAWWRCASADGSGDRWGQMMVMTEKPGAVGFFGLRGYGLKTGWFPWTWFWDLRGMERKCHVFFCMEDWSWMVFSPRKQPLNPSNGHGSKHIASHIFGDPLSNFPHRGAGKNRGFPQIPGIPKELHWNWNRQFREKGRVTSLGVSWLIWMEWLILPPLGWFEVSSRMEDGGPGGVVF